ncbi:MAG: hypothetical protein QOK48_2522 [Blastocatellia bacterium]|nr:hypothetical protein [Blastocatellia bacterium]
MGDADAVLSELPAGVGALALGEGNADGRGLGPVRDPEFAARAPGVFVLLAKFEFAVLAEVDRSAAFVEALFSREDVEVFRWLVFEFRFGPVIEEAFLFAGNGKEFRAPVFEFRFAPLFEGEDCRAVFELDEELPPGTVKMTSRWFARCSTRAVEPGCNRNETTVLSPTRCVFTSAKPRPRTASARGTSAPGILT